jgi:hypothetical protein
MFLVRMCYTLDCSLGGYGPAGWLRPMNIRAAQTIRSIIVATTLCLL